jgi:hypothetical protein
MFSYARPYVFYTFVDSNAAFVKGKRSIKYQKQLNGKKYFTLFVLWSQSR